MTANLRGVHLFRQLCRKHGDLGVPSNAATLRTDVAGHALWLRRSLSAQPATSLTSENSQFDDQTSRQAHLQAHEKLLQALQTAIFEGRADGDIDREQSMSPSKAMRRRRILQEFAPMKLLLSRSSGSLNLADKHVAAKWEQQIHAEWAQVYKLRQEYKEKSAQMKKAGKGNLIGQSKSIMVAWYDPLLQAIIKEQAACMAGDRGKDRIAYGPYLYALEPDILATLTIHGVLGSCLSEEEAGRVKLTRVAMAVGKMINEQIGVENMKRRVDLEHRRQRKLGKVQQKMWEDFAECQRMGYEWEPRRAQYESRLNDLQALKHIWVPELDDEEGVFDEDADADGPSGINLQFPAEQLRDTVFAKAEELASNSLLTDASQQQHRDPNEPAYVAMLDWFKVDPEYETRVKEIKKRWTKLNNRAASLTARQKQFYLGKENWEPKTVAKVGVVLTNLLLQSAKIEVDELDKHGHPTGNSVEEPAFAHSLVNTYDEKGKGWWKKFGMVTMHEALIHRLSDEEIAGAQIPRWIPMVIPPRDWVAPNVGGYLSQQPLIMRTRGASAQTSHLMEQHTQGKMQRVYDALNAMGKTAWSINPILLQQVEHAYRDLKGGFCGLPMHETLDVAPIPPPRRKSFRTEAHNGQLTAYFMDPVKREMLAWKASVNKAKKKNREMHSLRCDLSYKLDVARTYVKEEAFYYPHNLDFRGRAYPMHPSLNHLGADLSRGLLQFADAKPLGPQGLRWLEISVANLYGKGADKLSFDNRVQFARDHMHEVFDSADNPFNGAKWWQQADSPWQLLAVCYDLQAALSSGNPESYCSRLPVHQDGSCNGLQHYAALGRDEKGGRAVNLLPVDKPQDVYSQIAALVKAKVDRDAALGVPEALVLQENVDRKLVKQTVMTSVYGVTFVGARQQISSRLSERGWDDERLLYKTASYGATVTLASLHQMFDSAKDIMMWLSLCARVVARADQAVQWTTPLGLPVVQPYRKKSKSHVQTLLQRVILVHQTEESPIQRVRQRTAFPPNFIHCLDSSHMMLTAIDCQKAGLSFAGVHDSFWTHAGSVETMNNILREKFFELHSQPLLENLRNELQQLYPKLDIPEVPQLGSLDLNKITEADYFFN